MLRCEYSHRCRVKDSATIIGSCTAQYRGNSRIMGDAAVLIALADDHPIVRAALRAALASLGKRARASRRRAMRHPRSPW